MVERMSVAPQMLRWARERSGRPHDYLAEKFPNLDAWEAGDVKPTMRQLEDFAKSTYAPIGFMFLTEPPDERAS